MNRAESGLGQALRPGWATAGVAVFAGAALGAIGCKQDDNLPASRSEPEAIQMEEGAAGAETDIGVDAALLVIFKPLPALVDSFDNPSTPEKVELGRRLYFDERLSAAGDMSCNSCHPVDRFGTEERALQQGHGWDAPTRNAPSTFNAAGQVAMFWDGRVRTVEHAAERHILGPAPYGLENVDRLKERLASIPEYRPAFERAFPGEALDERTYSKAVGAYLRTLMTPAPWDEFLRWNPNALTREQKLGFLTFMRTGCQNCHIGTYLGGTSFQPLGAEEPWPEPAAGAPADSGRFEVTGEAEDKRVFRVPSLRNVTKTAPYFHDGSVGELPQAVRLMARHQLGKELNGEQVASIITFLETLTGEPTAQQTRRPEGNHGAHSPSDAPGGSE